MTDRRIRLRAVDRDVDKRWETDRRLRIGRFDEFEVVLKDTSISRRHAEIEFTGERWVVRDLGSTNGTFVNGVRVGRSDQSLRGEDILQCGNVVMIIEGLTEEPLDLSETPCGRIQVQATARQTLEEVGEQLALDITRSTRPGEQLLNLLRAGQSMDRIDSLDEFLSRNLKDTVAALGARRGSVILIEGDTGKINLRAVYPDKPKSGPDRFFSQTLIARCFRGGQSLLCADIVSDPEMLQAESVAGTPMSSIICALLRSPRKYLGVLHLDRGPSDNPFTREDLRRADALAANMSFSLESAQILQERQRALFIQTVLAFSQAIELRDPYTGGHAQRVTDYSLLLAEALALSEPECYLLRVGGPLHDVGKIGIDDQVLRKSGRLTPKEFEHMKSHTLKGAVILGTLPGLETVVPIVRNHHERWDGRGYPDRLAGENIPYLARVVAVADSFDAMTSNRPYRAGMPIEEALYQIETGAGSQFDPICARAFVRLRPALEQLLDQNGSHSRTISDISVLMARTAELSSEPAALPESVLAS
jgi:HD-GYP domain-containing protein (c-di-GMP phosphodiesterase class II)/pSer/pThr/pTyr-binding forkhead associated (FHA) protein